MVRPLKGERPKKITTISVDPEVCKNFKIVVEEKVFPKTSMSAHLEGFMRREIARLSGEDGAAMVINEAELQKRLNFLAKKCTTLRELVEKAGGDAALKRTETLLLKYKIDTEHWTNVEQVIRSVLIDCEREGSPVRTYMDNGGGSRTELNILIQYMRVCAEMHVVNAQLLEVLKQQAHINSEDIKAAHEAQGIEESEAAAKHADKAKQKPARAETKLPELEPDEDGESDFDPDYDEEQEGEWDEWEIVE